MPKIIGPPPISNLDGIIDMLTDPEKYAKYLQDLKNLHDTIQALCESYDTKESAQTLLRGAETKMREADEAVEKAAQDIVALQEAQEKDHAAAMEALHQREAVVVSKENALREAERSMSEREQSVSLREANARQQDQALQIREQNLVNRASVLDQRENKIKQAQAGLAALGL